MIVSRTPYRISFFGGGTDYPAWYRRHGGLVLATTINRYCYISCRYLPPFFEHRHRVVWSKIENVASISEIEHPAVRAVLECERLDEGVEIHHNGDLPARSGIGSSSSFTVGLIKALHALRGTDIGKTELAHGAIHIERDILNENVGAQDQISAAFGGLNRIELSPDGQFRLAPVTLSPERLQQLQSSLMLFFTGISRNGSDIAGSKIANMDKRAHELSRMQAMVDQAIAILRDPAVPIEEFGRLLDVNWRHKRKLSERVSTPEIDRIYRQALAAGATGGKMLGAGGGGFLLLYVRPELQQTVKHNLAHLVHVPFEFESSGSCVLLNHSLGAESSHSTAAIGTTS